MAWRCLRVERAKAIEPTRAVLPELNNKPFGAMAGDQRCSGQTDLIGRGSINLCEMKWSGAPFVIDKRYAATLRERVEIFRRVTGAVRAVTRFARHRAAQAFQCGAQATASPHCKKLPTHCGPQQA
jgi:hypothetical protein